MEGSGIVIGAVDVEPNPKVQQRTPALS